MSCFFNPAMGSPIYSTGAKSFEPLVSANTQSFDYASTQGQFRFSRCGQSDVLDIINRDPIEVGHLCCPYDVSIAETLRSTWPSVGKMTHGAKQVGTCSLISANMAIIPSHCIEDLDVRELVATFGQVRDQEGVRRGQSYRVQYVLEHDPNLDYAIVQIEGTPGLDFGYLPFDPESEAYSPPALLHHPLGKPLQVSVHTFVQTQYQTSLLATFHDSDYGSSGGAYISPSGRFIALHLGCERNRFSMNLERLALPIKTIIESRPGGILSLFAYRQLNQAEVYNNIGQPSYYLYPYFRDYIDLETFDRKNLLLDNAYFLRKPVDFLPGIIIDTHQAKHTIGWPGGHSGGKGTRSLTLDDTIHLAEMIINDESLGKLFNNSNPQNPSPSIIKWPVDKKVLGKEFFKRLGGAEKIEIHSGFNKKAKCWLLHFYPA